MEQQNSKITPLADTKLTNDLFSLIQEAGQYNQLRKGANEVTKTLNKGTAEIVAIAADTTPIEIVMHLPILCEDKNVPFVYVSSMESLGRACNVSRPVIAASITLDQNSQLRTKIDLMKKQIEKLSF